jgi:hypothetical protein
MFSSLAHLVLSLRVSYHNLIKFHDFTITARRRWSIKWGVQLRLNRVWHGIRVEVCANHPHWLRPLSLSTFWISSFIFEGPCDCVWPLSMTIDIISLTVFFFGLLQTMHDRLVSVFLTTFDAWSLEGHSSLQCWNWRHLWY